MRVVALISGGKDSCYNMMKCVQDGHEIVALVNLYPADLVDELDSYMYQSVGHKWIEYYSQAIDLPLFRHPIKGKPIKTDLEYDEPKHEDSHDEVEDLYDILVKIRSKIDFEAVSVGAIFSTYQGNRVQNICDRLGLQMLAYLWQKEQKQLLDEMIRDGVHAILIKVAAIGLDPNKHLGKNLQEMKPVLHDLHEKYQINVCGEGGEYETFTLDCPLFKKRIEINDAQIKIHSNDAFAPVGYLTEGHVRLIDKV